MGLQGTVIRTIFQTATSHGAAFDTLSQMSGIRPDEICNSENMVEWEKAALIWVPLLKMTNDPLIGLHVGMGTDKMLHGMVGFLIQSSKDLHQAQTILSKYGHLVSPMVEYKYLEKDVAILEMTQNKMWLMKHPEPARHAQDFLMASLINTSSALVGKRITPIRIELAYERRAVEEYRDFFGCDVLFNKETNRIVLDKKDTKSPILTSDQSMFERFTAMIAEKQALIANNSTEGNLKQVLFMQFKGRIPSVEEAAAAMETTPRSLQRKLLREQTSFRDVAGAIRKDIALQLMQNPAIKISEVSDILGYSDPTAFRKAFKSWTNTAPRAAIRKNGSRRVAN
jgi:AraC-like DNA-binding protein